MATGRGLTALVTGASAGIGKAFADVFAKNGFDLILTARREERLKTLAGELQAKHGIKASVCAMDLADPTGAERLVAEIKANGLKVDALVNNAGYGVPGSFLSSSWDRHADFLQVLLISVTELTYRLLPGMVERGYGRIINVASLAGLVPAPAGHTLYAAAKAFLIKFSESLAHEVRRHDVHVTALCPGFTFSEFHDVTGTRARMKSLPPFMWSSSSEVARQGYDAVMAGKSVVVTGRVNAAIATLVRMLPQRLVIGVGRRIGRQYRQQ